jgi:hypothetical protein
VGDTGALRWDRGGGSVDVTEASPMVYKTVDVSAGAAPHPNPLPKGEGARRRLESLLPSGEGGRRKWAG